MVTRNRVGTQAVATVATTSNNNPADPSKDNRVPGAPATLTATQTLEFTGGLYTVAVNLSWVMPLKATDGSLMTDIARTEIYHLKGTAAGVFIRASTVDYPDYTATLHGYGTGTTWQFKVRAVSANAKYSAFSNVVTQSMNAQAAPPAQPSMPDTSSSGLLAQVIWDGLAQGGGAMPADTDHIIVKRADDTNFTTNVVQVGTLLNAGTVMDGPFHVDDVYYYRFAAVNRMVATGPDSTSAPVVIVGTDGSSLTKGSVPPESFTDDLNAKIEAAIGSTAGNAVPGNRIFGPSATRPVSTDTDPLLPGDLWFDSGNQMRPWRYGGSDSGPPNHGWVDVRDSITQLAFSNTGNALSNAYLLPDTARTQLLAATATNPIAAGSFIAANSISTDVLVGGLSIFGVMDAGVLNAGYISADRIAANSITAEKILVADVTNFCNEPLFDNGGKGWTDPQAPAPEGGGLNATKELTVAANGGVPSRSSDGTIDYHDGWVYDAAGTGGAGYAIVNTRKLDVVETDQFYGELWVRKTTSATTGKIGLALTVTSGPNNTVAYMEIGSYTFKTTDPVNKWFQITGYLVPPPPPKPDPDKYGGPGIPVPNTLSLPSGAYKAYAEVFLDPTLAAGAKVQFANAVVRRKNTAQLIVDGSVTANSIAAQTITSKEISTNTITADNIKTNTISADEIYAGGISGTSADISVISTMLLRGQTIATTGWDATLMKPIYPGVTLSKDSLIYNDKNGAAWFELNFQTGAVMFNSAGNKTSSRYEIDKDGIRLYPAGSGAKPSVILRTTDGAAFFAGDISGSNGNFSGNLSAGTQITGATITGNTTQVGGTITGATIQTSASGARVFMNATLFEMTNAAGVSQILFKPGTHAAGGEIKLDSGSDHYPRFYLDTQGTSAGMTWYGPGGATDVNFKLDASDGSVTMVGGIISGGTITAASFQTAAGNPSIVLNPSWFLMTDDQGNHVVQFVPGTTSADASFLLDTGPDKYPRFTLNSASGLYWYNASKAVTFQLLFSDGSIKLTGPIVTSGTITGAAIQTGTSGARVTMDSINGIVAYNSSGAQVFYANLSGVAYFTGTVSASNVNTPKLNGGSIAGVTFGSGNSGGSFAGPTLNSPILGGNTSNGGAITGNGSGTVVSGTGPDRIVIVSNQMQIYANGSIGGLVGAYSNTNDVVIEGYGSGGQLWLGFNQNHGGGAFAVANGSSSSPPALYGYALQYSPITAVAGYAAVYVATSGAAYMGMFTSSVRYKKQVQSLELDPRFMDIQTATWADKPNRGTVAMRVSQPGVNRRSTGFTAENLHRTGMTDLVTYDAHRRPQAVQQAAVLAHNVRYTQHLVRQVQDLTARVAALEGGSMSYADVAAMVEDWELRMRLVACAAVEQQEAPVQFVEDNIWRICAQPAFGKAWGKTATATANDPDYKPGGDESVISDAMILTAVGKLTGDLQTKAMAKSRAVADDNAARLQDEDDREFRRHVRMREWELAHQPVAGTPADTEESS